MKALNIFLGIVGTVLLVLGVTELVRLLAFRWTKPLTGGSFALVAAPESGEDCECVLRAAAERIRWLDLKGPCRLVCLNRRGDPEIDSICRFLQLRHPFLTVCRPEELPELLKGEKAGKTAVPPNERGR